MKTIRARITMRLEIADAEFEKLKALQKLYGDIDLEEGELIERFRKNGKIEADDSYIPESWIEDSED